MMSPVSDVLDEIYQRIRDNLGLFVDPVQVFEPSNTSQGLFQPNVGVPLHVVFRSTVPDFLTHNLSGRFRDDIQLFGDIVSGRHKSYYLTIYDGVEHGNLAHAFFGQR